VYDETAVVFDISRGDTRTTLRSPGRIASKNNPWLPSENTPATTKSEPGRISPIIPLLMKTLQPFPDAWDAVAKAFCENLTPPMPIPGGLHP
jgi:hypothetical protein